jgi:hypothetical protein
MIITLFLNVFFSFVFLSTKLVFLDFKTASSKTFLSLIVAFELERVLAQKDKTLFLPLIIQSFAFFEPFTIFSLIVAKSIFLK